MQRKQEAVHKLYPSDISMRGYINSPDNLDHPNEIIYIVVEGSYLYFILINDMQIKFTVPTYDITQVKNIMSQKNLGINSTCEFLDAIVNNFHF